MAKAKPVVANDVMPCAHCGHEDHYYEKYAALDLIGLEHYFTLTCEKCKKESEVLMKVTLTFASFPTEEEN
ncbi:hypothetical protein HWC53_gp028 [Bacillus phage vB_BmeM-Goe8]|uniref:Uncharacterized protein n=1 Tax=Bacillus phage vB_BmeM-Goe8 TaxID=2593638 RepID=A0A516KMJ3_9CAUD|nr:hypothetical protein HWC53_gp028 [Bacillus phage vB_BmeM-Goe8]QDP42812.1 hypothetical protein Goe8_c00280 [Bacillus phage vB_BmeM-Goe8]